MKLRTHEVTLRSDRIVLRPMTEDDWQILLLEIGDQRLGDGAPLWSVDNVGCVYDVYDRYVG